ncbi:ChaN family lipoprotein [Aquicoccus sp.]|uniref:ChaN family lipoprotein n=1 Tax=Aquicoccus sp. TaxID=2055851 RepID=UPI0035677822
MRGLIVAALLSVASMVWADVPQEMRAADVVILGEVHDNANAHARQAELVAALHPGALVFEMLSPDQAGRVTPELRDDAEALAEALDWQAGGWPDFEMYHPIFTAAPEARVFGAAVPRGAARDAMEAGVVAFFGGDAALYGLDEPLDADQQTARERFQFKAHCEALPEEMLPAMVDLQRLRDAELARQTRAAMNETGGPVVVITGNGHARKDWGMPVYLERVMPEAKVFSLAIAEEGEAEGAFDAVEEVPVAEREDPCAAFRKDG